jgi:gamma-glutamyl AIG2-like cyclotransferase
MATTTATELLFSYGTLQLEAVQLALFGRRLTGTPDLLPLFKEILLEIDDEATVRMSGKTHHAMAQFSGDPSDAIRGTALELTPAEIERADKYEVAAYKRVAVILGSRRRAWAYVDAKHTASDA